MAPSLSVSSGTGGLGMGGGGSAVCLSGSAPFGPRDKPLGSRGCLSPTLVTLWIRRKPALSDLAHRRRRHNQYVDLLTLKFTPSDIVVVTSCYCTYIITHFDTQKRFGTDKNHFLRFSGFWRSSILFLPRKNCEYHSPSWGSRPLATRERNHRRI